MQERPPLIFSHCTTVSFSLAYDVLVQYIDSVLLNQLVITRWREYASYSLINLYTTLGGPQKNVLDTLINQRQVSD